MIVNFGGCQVGSERVGTCFEMGFGIRRRPNRPNTVRRPKDQLMPSTEAKQVAYDLIFSIDRQHPFTPGSNTNEINQIDFKACPYPPSNVSHHPA